MPSEETKNYRPQFTEFLKTLSASPVPSDKYNPVTLYIVRAMNDEMTANKNTMSKGHFEAAKASIERGDSLTKFMFEENLHVLNSHGEGWVYNSGKFVHQTLRGAIIVKDGAVVILDKTKTKVQKLIR